MNSALGTLMNSFITSWPGAPGPIIPSRTRSLAPRTELYCAAVRVNPAPATPRIESTRKSRRFFLSIAIFHPFCLEREFQPELNYSWIESACHLSKSRVAHSCPRVVEVRAIGEIEELTSELTSHTLGHTKLSEK